MGKRGLAGNCQECARKGRLTDVMVSRAGPMRSGAPGAHHQAEAGKLAKVSPAARKPSAKLLAPTANEANPNKAAAKNGQRCRFRCARRSGLERDLNFAEPISVTAHRQYGGAAEQHVKTEPWCCGM